MSWPARSSYPLTAPPSATSRSMSMSVLLPLAVIQQSYPVVTLALPDEEEVHDGYRIARLDGAREATGS
jgi:hypothetical protein